MDGDTNDGVDDDLYVDVNGDVWSHDVDDRIGNGMVDDVNDNVCWYLVTTSGGDIWWLRLVVTKITPMATSGGNV